MGIWPDLPGYVYESRAQVLLFENGLETGCHDPGQEN